MKNSINSVVKAVSVMKCFSLIALDLSTAEVSKKTGLPYATAYRLLTTLTNSGLLERNLTTRKYSIGTGLYAMGNLYLESTDIIRAAEPVVKTLNELTGEIVSASILERGNTVLILREQARYRASPPHHVGSILPGHASAMGKMLLSTLSEEALDAYIPEDSLPRYTPNTIATKTELKVELENIRRTGISFDREGLYEGEEGIAALIRNNDDTPVAAISFGLSAFRLTGAKEDFLATFIQLGANIVSYRLGYKNSKITVRNMEELRSWYEQNKITIYTQSNNSSSYGTNQIQGKPLH